MLLGVVSDTHGHVPATTIAPFACSKPSSGPGDPLRRHWFERNCSVVFRLAYDFVFGNVDHDRVVRERL